MNNLKEIRWKQRFENFDKAFKLLEKFNKLENPDEIERAGGIQFFEMAIELAWKTIKDYLEDQGYIVKSPRESIKTAFQHDLLINGHDWLDALDDRNLTVYTYDEGTAEIVISRIKCKYFPLLKDLHGKFLKEL